MYTDIKVSPFAHFKKLDKYHSYAVYNSLFLKKFFCNKETVNKIKTLNFKKKDPLIKYLTKNRFIIKASRKPKDEINYLIKKEGLSFSKPKFKVFYMIITTACNFRCKYCYLSSLVDHKPRVMSLETSKRALNYFYNYIKKVKDEPPKLVLYGGEPLLNTEVMKFVIEDVRKNEKHKNIPHVSLILITNGSLLDKGITKFLKRNKILVAVSLDGPKNINDSNRVYKSGKGTYDDTIKSIKLLLDEGLNPTISCTVNNNNVGKLTKVIPWMVKNFKINSLGLNLFSGGDCSNKLIKRLSKNSARQVINAFKICRKYGVYEDTILRQMTAFVDEKPNIYYCAATGREISVDPDGNLATCPAFLNTKMFNLNIDNNPVLEKNPEFKKWVRRSPLLNKKCYSCIALGICGGGCAFNSYKNHKHIYAKDEFYCEYAKSVAEWMLKDLHKITMRRVHG